MIKRSHAVTLRQMTALSCVLVLLVGCTFDEYFSGKSEADRGTIGYLPGDFGAIAVDEPQAALIGRDILTSGGSAADAATAMVFALSVTMPSSASLGGGGVCIVRDGQKGLPVVIDFLPQAPAEVAPGTERPSAVPAMPRGLFLLHSRYGKLKWEQVMTPAENLARFGYSVPRAFAVQFDKVKDALLRDVEASKVFRKADGNPIGEGDFLVQPQLAGTLSLLRRQGVGELYVGQGAANLVAAVARAGGSLVTQDLRDYRPALRDPISFKWEKNTVWHFAAPPTAGGAVAAEMTATLLSNLRFEKAGEAERVHLLAEAAKRAFAHRMKYMQPNGMYTEGPGKFIEPDAAEAANDSIADAAATPLTQLVSAPVDWPETPSAISLTAIDIDGGAVACNLTMNNVFGTGRIVPEFGIMLAAAPDQRGRTYTPLGPALLTNEFTNQAFMAIAASGGVTAPTSLVNVLTRAAAGPQSLKESIRAPRVHYAGVPDKVFAEADTPPEVVERLRKIGHDVVITQSIGTVEAIYCPTGIPTKGELQCESATDPRGHGVAFGGN